MARGRIHRSSKAYKAYDPHGQMCHYGCGRPATTRDHQPPLALHEHIEGSGCCVLLPACAVCNARDGQRISAMLAKQYAIARNKRTAERRAKRYGPLAHDPTVW